MKKFVVILSMNSVTRCVEGIHKVRMFQFPLEIIFLAFFKVDLGKYFDLGVRTVLQQKKVYRFQTAII